MNMVLKIDQENRWLCDFLKNPSPNEKYAPSFLLTASGIHVQNVAEI